MGRTQEFTTGTAQAPKAGDPVTLHDGSQGQIWSQAPGANQWHAVGSDQTAHIYNAKTGESRPANGQWLSGSSRRRGHLNNTEANALSKVKRKVV